MSGIDIQCPHCGGVVRLREQASLEAGKLVYRCRSCERSFSYLGGKATAGEAGTRPARMRAPEARPVEAPDRLREISSPSREGGLPPGIVVTLEFIDGPDRGRSIAVRSSRSYLGRESDDIALADPLVSRRHAVIDVYDPETVILKDLASTNGTWHNGSLIDHCKLSDGDEVRVGGSILNVLIDRPA